MHIVHVFVHVKPGSEAAFEEATLAVLVEVYRTPEAALAHKETAHYATWRDTVAGMMAEPRSSVKYVNLHPQDADWR